MYNDNEQCLSTWFNIFHEALSLRLFYGWKNQGTLRLLTFYGSSLFQVWCESLETEERLMLKGNGAEILITTLFVQKYHC